MWEIPQFRSNNQACQVHTGMSRDVTTSLYAYEDLKKNRASSTGDKVTPEHNLSCQPLIDGSNMLLLVVINIITKSKL